MGHIHEKIDFTASVLIVHDNKVLMHRHKIFGIWLPPGGHIELDEDPNETAIREAKEESGLDVQLVGEVVTHDVASGARDLIPPKFLNRHYFNEKKEHEHIDFVYFARPKSDVSKATHEHEGGGIRWFTREEMERNEESILPDIRAHALAALQELAS